MTEGAKNTILGVALTALLGIGFASVSQSFDNGKHLTKIDAVLEQQKDILGELKKSASAIPAPVETKLEELRWRLNSLEGRVNRLDSGVEPQKKMDFQKRLNPLLDIPEPQHRVELP